MFYNLSVSGDWKDGSQFLTLPSFSSVAVPARMLLLSDGSLTRLLNAIFLFPVRLHILRQREVVLDNEMAGYIGADTGQKVIDRDVWLFNDREKLVYANSILPTSFMRDDIYNEITKGDTPIGTLLSEQSIFTRRDMLQITRVSSQDVSRELGLPDDTEFWARRYRLNTEGGFKGMIQEVFSPRLFEELR